MAVIYRISRKRRPIIRRRRPLTRTQQIGLIPLSSSVSYYWISGADAATTDTSGYTAIPNQLVGIDLIQTGVTAWAGSAVFAGAGSARWTSVDIIDQILAANAALAGAGGLVTPNLLKVIN